MAPDAILRYERWWELQYQGRTYWVMAWTEHDALTLFVDWLEHPVETERVTRHRPY